MSYVTRCCLEALDILRGFGLVRTTVVCFFALL